jgi:DNA-binding MarR family transcriptional regulator
MQLMGVYRRLRHETRADDRSWARLMVLGAIDRHDGRATPSVLAADHGMRSSNLAAALRSLEARKLIVRTPDTEDRGRRLLDDSRARRDRWLAEATAGCLTAKERALLIKAGALLERIVAGSETDEPQARRQARYAVNTRSPGESWPELYRSRRA